MKLLTTSGRGAGAARRALATIQARQRLNTEGVAVAVGRIVDAVQKGGDTALRRYAARLDGLPLDAPLRVSRDEMAQAWEVLPERIREALRSAAANIRSFAERQLPKAWEYSPVGGLTTGQVIRAIGNVGCYVPSGRHPLPSTLLMTVIPAQVAGVKRIVAVSANPAPATLAAAHLLGLTEFYRVGGAQGIAALAYGTETINPVDKIVGPGNVYVTTAKKLVAFDCAIDMLAGPTEVLIASEAGQPDYIAADLVAQAEHDPNALAILITTRLKLAKDVIRDVKLRSRHNSTAKAALKTNGYAFVTANGAEARDLVNRIGPEHLTVDDEKDIEWVMNAGSVFVGKWSAQPMGDYVSGPNHTLPTGGSAKSRGGLSVLDFIKPITVQNYTRTGLNKLGPAGIALAEVEGLTAHAEAINTRLLNRPATKEDGRDG